MQTVISSGDKNLVRSAPSGFPWGWYAHTDEPSDRPIENQHDPMRASGYVYLAGFSTKQQAINYGIEQGWLEDEKPEDDQGCL